MSAKHKKPKNPVITAKKHWIVYIFPLAVAAAGIFLTITGQDFIKIAGLGIILLGLFLIAQKATIKWIVTDHHLYIQTGYGPWSKKYEQIPLIEVYKSTASVNAFGRVFNFGTITTHKREGRQGKYKHYNISNAHELAVSINTLAKNSPLSDLNMAYELREKGLISEHEYNLMKLGHVTHHYLS